MSQRSSRCKLGDRKFRDGSTQASTRCLKRRKKSQRESSERKRFSQHGIIHGSGRRKERRGKKGEWAARALRLTRIAVVRSITGSQRAPPPARRVWNLDVNKVGAADSLTGAVMAMVIIVVERIKRSRRKEVDGGQLKWTVDKSRQLEEGKPYCTVVRNRKRSPLPAGYEVKVVAAKAESGPMQPTRLVTSAGAGPNLNWRRNTFISYGNTIPSVGPLFRSK